MTLDYDLIALVTPLPDYRLCWMLNRLLDVDFLRVDDIEVNFPRRKQIGFFPRFRYYRPVERQLYHLVVNKGRHFNLLPEHGKVDYILMIRGFEESDSRTELVLQLRNIRQVQAVFALEPDDLKSKSNLIFDDDADLE